jgi:hypothetical protein
MTSTLPIRDFFSEWYDPLPELNEAERQRLDRVKASYRHLLNYPPLLENTVKMMVLSPLLELADLYLPPFHIKSEPSVAIEAEDDGTIYRGQIDVLAICDRLWVSAIESKQAALSLEMGKLQLPGLHAGKSEWRGSNIWIVEQWE